MGYPKKKCCGESGKKCIVHNEHIGFNEAIDKFSAEIRRLCSISEISLIMNLNGVATRKILKVAKAICKHFEEDLE